VDDLSYGIDGCRAGWIVAAARGLEATPEFSLVPTFERVVRMVESGGGITCVDVPIGLCDGRRSCDHAARAMLTSARASSVFTPPSRKALTGNGHAEERARNIAATGRSLSSQALGIVPKIREVDEVMTPALQDRIREVHPEVTFASLSDAGIGLAAAKKTRAGSDQRLALLPPAFARAVADATKRPFRREQVAPDDYIDALAALVTAIRISRGEGKRLPAAGEELDERGLRMEIVY
jgi:predicted RNase H-like nuclease